MRVRDTPARLRYMHTRIPALDSTHKQTHHCCLLLLLLRLASDADAHEIHDDVWGIHVCGPTSSDGEREREREEEDER